MNKLGTEIYFITEGILNKGDTFYIPEGVEKFKISITKYKNFTKLVIPSSLKEIVKNGLPRSIITIEVSKDNQNFCTENNCLYSIDKKTLYYCYSKEEDITLSEGLEKIDNGAFLTALNAKNIILPDSLLYIDERVFQENKNMESLYIGKNVNHINSLFKYTNYSGTVTIDENNQNYMIRDDILYSKDGKKIITCLKKIKGSYVVEKDVEIIGNLAFYNQNEMTQIELPQGLKQIDTQAFGYCDLLTRIEVPSSITTLNAFSFDANNNLTEIIINKKEGSISGAPWGCKYGMKAIKWNG